jgi:hypothetical protein
VLYKGKGNESSLDSYRYTALELPYSKYSQGHFSLYSVFDKNETTCNLDLRFSEWWDNKNY